METLKEKIRALEAKKQAHAKTIDKARDARKAVAFKAHADGDDKAAAVLTKSRENELRAAMELEDIVNALSEGRAMFEKLEKEWKSVLSAEAWAGLMAEAEQARKEAEQIDTAMTAFAKLLAAHGKKLEHLKNASHNLGMDLAFRTVGLRHVKRVFDWRLIQEGLDADVEKPSEQYRNASGYSSILAEQIDAAKSAREMAIKEGEAATETEAKAESEAAA
ncbi:MAG: hypothetical protein HYY81_07425 [Deltaproteobacteria bacterium]|nr:hypothetical protein [Deltaproteobacteria bacterium]